GQGLPAGARPDLDRADDLPLYRAHRRALVRQRAQPSRRDPPSRARDPRHLRREGRHAAPALYQDLRRHRGLEALVRLEPSVLELLGKVQGVQQKIGISIKDLKEINKQMSTGEAKARRAK